ncbi:MAG: four helix bundle protein [Phycisphaeraceae bacterium]
MDADAMRQRTKLFALRILRLVKSMPRSVEARAIAQQIVRSGTSIGANYRSACRGRSRAEFAAKLAIALEEADETAWWLELIIEGEILTANRVQPLLTEANELTAILSAARQTTRRNTPNLK